MILISGAASDASFGTSGGDDRSQTSGVRQWNSAPAPSVPVYDFEGYEYAWEDLRDIADAASENSGEIRPDDATIHHAAELLSVIAGSLPAPEISTRENGTLLLMWRAVTGYITVELGNAAYGLLAVASGTPSLRRNGSIEALLGSLNPARRNALNHLAALSVLSSASHTNRPLLENIGSNVSISSDDFATAG